MSFQIGERIGDYQVIDVLGAGGMGKVYKVKNVFSERIEAMKVLLPNLSSDPELADRFMREIKVQASLEHSNIAGLRTAQQVGNQLVMIVEFVDGSSLEEFMRQGPVPLATAVECISQVLSALSYAHEKGIIHRDIKPGNIMLTRSGVVKLMDFGIAKAVADRRLTQTGRTVGSLYYMSPEQIQGSPNLDGRADLYSLGVTLYELVTGRRPFQGDSDYSIMAAHLSQTPVPPIQLDPKVPSALNEVILQSIAKDPAQRFQSAGAFRNALDSVARALSMPVAATVPLPAPSTAAPVAHAAAEADVTPGSGKRALYMVAGSLATLVILGVAAFQLPRYLGAEAGQPEPAAEVQAPVQEDPAPAPPASNPAGVMPPGEMVQRPPAVRELARPDVQNTQRPSAAVVQPKSASSVGSGPEVPPQSPPSTVQVAQANPPQTQSPIITSPPAQAPAPAPVNAAELDGLADRFNLMATRANAARASLKRLEESQARMGLGLRGDMTAAASRMAVFMDQAEAALKSTDAAQSRKAMDSAERELERIEKVLEGR